jgi:hypothetical protein
MQTPQDPPYMALPPDHPDLHQALRIAVLDEDRTMVHKLLAKGVDIEPVMRGVGYNRLVLAARFDLVDILDAEHAKGIHAPYYYHEALHFAAGAGHRDLVYHMLNYGFDATSTKDFDIAGAALLGGHVELLQEFMAKGFKTDLACKYMMEGIVEENRGNSLDIQLQNGGDIDHAKFLLAKDKERFPKSPYDTIEAVLEKWDARTEVIGSARPLPATITALRTQTDGFTHFAQSGRFDEVMQMAARDAQNKIVLDDVIARDAKGNNTLEILGAQQKLSALLQPDYWLNRPDEFMRICRYVPPVYQDQVKAERFTAAQQRDVLRQRARQQTFKPKGL